MCSPRNFLRQWSAIVSHYNTNIIKGRSDKSLEVFVPTCGFVSLFRPFNSGLTTSLRERLVSTNNGDIQQRQAKMRPQSGQQDKRQRIILRVLNTEKALFPEWSIIVCVCAFPSPQKMAPETQTPCCLTPTHSRHDPAKLLMFVYFLARQ